ncbi:putative leucine-rich repeat-containing protein DDB_G0290503 [Agrilus planipennis]|uniref:Leucine-rich repeat-containing protein DDB_G0290503 n=1 Tax=Agrilus planipennis TaxID=224129 RepID=A0A1W4X608_AGRPL|nr:putative leucine-rich repeat-containing protein DDB_G0290503 [Agrilus planipennis]XP_018331499.1 putative leucine-rich repeat-containing protein DDB_G0290503 [Agrilus planipennis]
MTTDPKPQDFYLDNRNPSNEEEEDEEEHLRRQEEIKNLLNVAMGDFNYDESTLNSLNCSADPVEESHISLREKYKEADYTDTLKALYESRTKELENLSKKLVETEKAKSELENQKQRQIICLQADLEQMKLALKQCETVHVMKTEEVNQLLEEKQVLLKNIEEMKEKIEEVAEQRDALHTANNNLHQQLTFLEKGFNPKLDAEAAKEQELKNKIDDLTAEIEKLEKIIKKQENEFTSHKQMLERMLQEKDEICQDRNAEIKKFDLELHRKEMDCINLNAELQRLNREKEDLKCTIQKLKTTELCNLSLNNLNDQLKKLAAENKEMKTKIQQYLQDIIEHDKMKEEYEKAKIAIEEINKIEVAKKEKVDRGIQVADKNQTRDIGLQIDNLKSVDAKTLSKIKELEEENAFLREKDSQRQEQEVLLNDLQKVAQEFEKVIQERNSKTCQSQSTNTEGDLLETIKIHYETQIMKLEVQLREEIKEEFNKKLRQKEYLMSHQLTQIKKTLSLEAEKAVKDIVQKMKDDRKATIELLNELRQKFIQMEEEIKDYKTKYLEVATENCELKKYLIKLKHQYQQDLKMTLQNHQQNYNFVIAKFVAQKEEKLKTKVSNIVKSLQIFNNKIEAIQGKIIEIPEQDT